MCAAIGLALAGVFGVLMDLVLVPLIAFMTFPVLLVWCGRKPSAPSDPGCDARAAHDALAFARRYDRPLGLCRLVTNGVANNQSGPALASATRAGEVVWWDHRAVYAVFLESDRAAAERGASRLEGLLADAGVPVHRVTVASFPEDGLTIDALFEALHDRPRLPAVGTETVDRHDPVGPVSHRPRAVAATGAKTRKKAVL